MLAPGVNAVHGAWTSTTADAKEILNMLRPTSVRLCSYSDDKKRTQALGER
jgi:hypothetical protein